MQAYNTRNEKDKVNTEPGMNISFVNETKGKRNSERCKTGEKLPKKELKKTIETNLKDLKLPQN